MKKSLWIKIMTIAASLGTVFCAINWYDIASGIWTPYNKNGEAVGPLGFVLATLVCAALAVYGIILWVRSAKAKKQAK